MLLAYVIAVGLAAAGIATSLRELVTARPAAFAVAGGSYPALLIGLAGIALTGPILVLRAGWRAWLEDGRPIRWLALAGLVALLWSGCTGVLILDVALGLRHSLS